MTKENLPKKRKFSEFDNNQESSVPLLDMPPAYTEDYFPEPSAPLQDRLPSYEDSEAHKFSNVQEFAAPPPYSAPPSYGESFPEPSAPSYEDSFPKPSAPPLPKVVQAKKNPRDQVQKNRRPATRSVANYADVNFVLTDLDLIIQKEFPARPLNPVNRVNSERSSKRRKHNDLEKNRSIFNMPIDIYSLKDVFTKELVSFESQRDFLVEHLQRFLDARDSAPYLSNEIQLVESYKICNDKEALYEVMEKSCASTLDYSFRASMSRQVQQLFPDLVFRLLTGELPSKFVSASPARKICFFNNSSPAVSSSSESLFSDSSQEVPFQKG